MPNRQPERFDPSSVFFVRASLPVLSLFTKLTDAVLPLTIVTFWGLVLEHTYRPSIPELVCPNSLT